jgi:hypothetical protein
LRCRALGAALLLTAVACSSKSGGNESSFVQQFCALVTPCCAAAGLSTTGDQCDLLATTATSGSGYSESTAQACLSAAQAEQTAGTFCTTLGGDIGSCTQVFQQGSGSVQPGQPCQEDADCAPAAGGGAACFDVGVVEDAGASTGAVCVQTTAGQAGQGPCIGTQEGDVTSYAWTGTGAAPTTAYVCSIATGSYCDAASQKCVALAAVGQPCTSDSTCVTSAYCNSSTVSPVCATRLADGSSCATAPTACLTTSACNPVTNVCQALIAAGGACESDVECASGSCVADTCASGAANSPVTVYCGG